MQTGGGAHEPAAAGHTRSGERYGRPGCRAADGYGGNGTMADLLHAAPDLSPEKAHGAALLTPPADDLAPKFAEADALATRILRPGCTRAARSSLPLNGRSKKTPLSAQVLAPLGVLLTMAVADAGPLPEQSAGEDPRMFSQPCSPGLQEERKLRTGVLQRPLAVTTSMREAARSSSGCLCDPVLGHSDNRILRVAWPATARITTRASSHRDILRRDRCRRGRRRA